MPNSPVARALMGSAFRSGGPSGILRPNPQIGYEVEPAPKFILDKLSVPALAAFSLRKLRGAYTGKAIRVQRSSDNAQLDIGFTSGGDLDVSSLGAFVGGNPNMGYVVKRYDQSGNGYDQTPSGASPTGPIIINLGSLVTIGSNSRAALFFLVNTSTQLGKAGVALSGNAATISAIAKPSVYASGASERVFDFLGNGQAHDFDNAASWIIFRDSSSAIHAFCNGVESTATYVGGTPYQWAAIFDGAHVTFYQDQIAQTAGNVVPTWGSPGTLRAGGDSPDEAGMGFDGYIGEDILHASALGSTDRTTLWTDQQTYYGV